MKKPHGSIVGSMGGTLLSMVLGVSCSSGGGTPETGSPTEAAGSPSPAVQILADCHEEMCEGDLHPGAYRSAFFEPTIDFEIASPGWTWRYAGSFAMIADESHQDLYASDGIYFLRDPAIASQDCGDEEATESVEPGVGSSVRQLVTWLEAAPSLDVSEPVEVTVGGLDGMLLDLQLDPEWKETCFYSEAMPAAPLIINKADIGGYNWAMFPGMSLRWYVLDSDDGVMVVDIEDSPGGASHDDLLSTGSQIVDSLTFSATS
jgi:hypothetical protein